MEEQYREALRQSGQFYSYRAGRVFISNWNNCNGQFGSSSLDIRFAFIKSIAAAAADQSWGAERTDLAGKQQ